MNRIIIFFACLLATIGTYAQSAFTGIWEGKMNAGVEITMIFHISQDASKNFIVTIDCPEQGLRGVKASSVTVSHDSLNWEMKQFGASYSGKLKGDSALIGTLKQGVSLTLNMKKVEKITEVVRAQTPVPPFPYRSEDIVYANKNKSISYGATITIPPGKGPFPAVLLLTGSGAQNRDEEIMGHKPFAVIADHLTKNGFIVLRVDDRGVGKTTGNGGIATTRDFADDATVSLGYLLARPEVDKKKIGLIGHSEGGMIAQIVAAERKDINFVVMLAGPGEQTMKVMNDQNEAMLLKAGMSKEYVAAYLELYKNIITTILAADSTSATAKVTPVVDEWINKTSKI
jgi:alpha/beta superfamily hydrolase